MMQSKAALRKHLRAERLAHVAAIPETTLGLLFRHPPAPLLRHIPAGSTIGLYRAMPGEAPAARYAAFFAERGHAIALPRFAGAAAPMEFARHTDPFDEADLQPGPYGLLQPPPDADVLVPDVLFAPLVGFTADCHRLGQGGGHYDRWLAEHPGTVAIGLGWDCQLCAELPVEPHDMPLAAVVTPTRLFGEL
ncbi:5-formyltetrahydrofolate cyclo-ligase [Altererythrobacter sp. H2]|nr:5-formyltetrahydrofolate cyclo-ligase [Altererythrobacter sp. H2]WRK94898.1 5-formyltetrahydrofolate cyclo-ligase [Altererythrobacter sp. H2]